MKQNNDFFDDVKKAAQSTFVTMTNVKNDITKLVTEQIKSMLKSMDVVTRSEFNVIKKIALDTRKELDEHKKGGVTMKKAATKKPAAKKAVAKKPAAKKAKAKK